MASTNMITYIRCVLTALVKCFVMDELYELGWTYFAFSSLPFPAIIFAQYFAQSLGNLTVTSCT